MMAWVSPSATVRLTPRRISRSEPSASLTEACRSRISRVDTVQLLLYRHEDVVALDLDGVTGHRLGGGHRGRPTGPQVEARPVQPALDGVAVDLALRQGHGGVRAPVADRV